MDLKQKEIKSTDLLENNFYYINMARFIFTILAFFVFLNPAISQISRYPDRFSNKVMLSTPIFGTFNSSPAIMSKVITEQNTTYYLKLSVNGATLNVGESGAKVLFSNGDIWESDTEVKADVDELTMDWNYYIFVSLTPDELELFSKNTIDLFRLYIYDRSLTKREANRFLKNVNELIRSK